MSNNVPFIVSLDSVILILQGRPVPITDTHPNFTVIKDHLKAGTGDQDTLEPLTDIPKWINAQIKHEDIAVTEDTVYFKGVPIENFLTQRMITMLEQGFDILPWVKFMTKLYTHPDERARNELFGWLDKAQMPITPDGNFLAYKKVRSDYMSFHHNPDGSAVSNKIGDTVSMERDAVDANPDRTCSRGLHFCSYSYLPSYHGNTGKVVVLEINPHDVVAIPTDYNCAKGRAASYKVVGEVPEKEVEHLWANRSVATGDNDYYDDDDDDFDDSWDDWYN